MFLSLLPKLIALLAVAMYMFYAGKEPNVESKGFAEHGYEEVKTIFDKVLVEESQGVSLSVLHKGKLVVDLYGGYADKSAERKWDQNTMAVAYSSTKIFGGLVFGVLASRGLIRYDSLVTDYWPEFGKNGKSNLTVLDILDHRAGLIKFESEFELVQAHDKDFISRLIEESTPIWPAGSQVGYHALTYGFILDQLCRRVDPKKRTVAQIYEEEILTKLEEKDFFIGIPKSEHFRVARVANPPFSESVIAHASKPVRFYEIIKTFVQFNGMADITANYPHFLSVMRTDSIPYNNADVQQLPLISSLGIGTTRAFARAVRQFWKNKLISNEIWEQFSKPLSHQFDICLAMTKSFGHGFFYQQLPEDKNDYSIIFVGNGQQFVEMHQSKDVVITLLRNGLKAGDWGIEEYNKIRNIVYKNINKL